MIDWQTQSRVSSKVEDSESGVEFNSAYEAGTERQRRCTGLSERELQVLKHMAAGKSNKEIAQVIYVSENTVKAHVKSILTKMNAMGRTEAIAIALKRGLIEAP